MSPGGEESGALGLRLAPAVVLALLACQGEPTAPSSPEPSSAVPALAAAAAQPLAFRLVSAGDHFTCGLTTDDRAYCWGDNSAGQLGDGTTTRRLTPVPVSGGLRFEQLDAGLDHTCAVTTDDRAYCWGDNFFGQVGDGTTSREPRTTPTLVGGGRRFRQVSAGAFHTCGVNPAGVGFCWGSHHFDVLGTGSLAAVSTPARIAGNLRFRYVSAGYSHTCAATTNDRGYCWGLDIGSRPVAVPGSIPFRRLLVGSGRIFSAGPVEPLGRLTCGITAGNRAYCWGSDAATGTGVFGVTPVELPGNRRWRSVSPGEVHACGVTLAQVAFCWGNNSLGQVGDGSTSQRPSPVRVAGGHRWTGLSASSLGEHTCGVTTDNRALCWGRNGSGELGDGTSTNRSTPGPVAGPS